MTWTSTRGIELPDLVPAALRRSWVEQGHCPDRDTYALFADHERAHPDRPAVIDEAGTVGYAELGRHARRIAGTLHATGLGPRDIIAVQLPNGRHALAAELAVAALGAVALPIPTDRGHRDTLGLLRRSGAGAVIVTASAQVDPPCPAIPVESAVDAHEYAPVPVAAESPARILVSSGTETEPKMVAYSHNAMAGGRGNYLRALYAGSEPPRSLVLVPLASSYGSLGIVTLARIGGTLVLPDRFEPSAALRAIEIHRPSHLFGVPTMLRRMLSSGDAADVSSLRTVVSSGMPLDPVSRHDCRQRFGCPVVNVYGSADGVNCHTAREGSGLGRPDPAVAALWVAEHGEICALGPMTPLCYVNAPELDARYRTPEGGTRTGDRGHFDSDGNLHLVDRLKQIVIRGGHNISIAEVERHLLAHRSIADATCVPVPDADLGERLCACVVPAPGTPPVGLPELTRHLEADRGLDRRKLPEFLLVLSELPLGPTGKVCRTSLTRLAAGLVRSGAPETTPETTGR